MLWNPEITVDFSSSLISHIQSIRKVYFSTSPKYLKSNHFSLPPLLWPQTSLHQSLPGLERNLPTGYLPHRSLGGLLQCMSDWFNPQLKPSHCTWRKDRLLKMPSDSPQNLDSTHHSGPIPPSLLIAHHQPCWLLSSSKSLPPAPAARTAADKSPWRCLLLLFPGEAQMLFLQRGPLLILLLKKQVFHILVMLYISHYLIFF